MLTESPQDHRLLCHVNICLGKPSLSVLVAELSDNLSNEGELPTYCHPSYIISACVLEGGLNAAVV